MPLLLLLALLVGCAAPGGQEAPRRPNLLVVMVDDLGWQDVSLPLGPDPTPFNQRYRTPHLEALAARGLAFTDAYASAPVCTPTRVSFMTGQAPARHHVTWWVLRADEDRSNPHPTLAPPSWRVNGLQPRDVTLAALLGGVGYRTIHVGKAHLGAEGTPGADPRNLGFDVNIAGHGAGGPGSFLGTQSFSARHRNADPVWDVPGLDAYHGQEIFLTEALTAEAVRALEEAEAAGAPFFLHFAPYAVHAPITANPRHLDDDSDLHPTEAAYASMVESVDVALGELLATLERLGQLEDTLVVFTSDNGGLSAHGRGGTAHTHNAPLRSGKGSAYEGGLRVPMVVAGPGVRARGRCADPVITHDLFPTLLAAAGATVPVGHPVDGVDLAPVLRGEPLAERALYWHQPHQWGARGPGIWPFSAVRRGDRKLIHDHASGRLESYDLASDLGERTDQGPDPALAEDLGRWLEQVGAQPSLDRDTGAQVRLVR